MGSVSLVLSEFLFFKSSQLGKHRDACVYPVCSKLRYANTSLCSHWIYINLNDRNQ